MNAFFYINTKSYIGPNLNVADNRFEFGIVLGVRAVSNEIFVGTSSSVKKVRIIHIVSDDKKWLADEFNKFRGLPWKRDAQDCRELPVDEQLRPIHMKEATPRSIRSMHHNQKQISNLVVSAYTRAID